jgi:hypothetical protein
LHGHQHPHSHPHAPSSGGLLFFALALTLGFAAVEALAGWFVDLPDVGNAMAAVPGDAPSTTCISGRSPPVALHCPRTS